MFLIRFLKLNLMTRVTLGPNDVLFPFDLRAQNFRVNVEFFTCHRGQKNFRKNGQNLDKIFEKMSESDLLARKKKDFF